MIKNNKEKTFTGNVHIFSNDDSKLPLWNTNTNSFVDSVMTNNIIEVQAEDKNEATKYINQIFAK